MLKLLQINCLDLFIFLDHVPAKQITEYSEAEWQSLTISQKGNKPLEKVSDLAKTLLNCDADVILLNEVGGVESLSNFNELFLHNKYNVAMAKGRSTRGIDTGFLVKKGIEFSCKGYSKVNLENGQYFKFSRTVNKLSLKKDGQVLLNIFGVHLKSKREGSNDHKSTETRYNEVKHLCALVQSDFEKHKVPYIVAGDFNGVAAEAVRDFEFDSLYDLELKDIHDLVSSSEMERYSYVHFQESFINYQQIDYIFLSPEIQNKLVKAQRWLYGDNSEYSHIVTLDQKRKEPSDHYPQMAYIGINVK